MLHIYYSGSWDRVHEYSQYCPENADELSKNTKMERVKYREMPIWVNAWHHKTGIRDENLK